ncbi:MAG: energy-coupling factor ABC transporter ATP-binding protein [Ruminiclostridium sp.]|nr:energy-coupling factor ABC transporter ATP-binding protein [Ruminiclostridium sp.]
MEILDIKDLSFTYPLAAAPTLDSISFSVNEGELVALCGATGSGKSTLLRLIKKELAPLGEKSGTVKFRGKSTEDCIPSDIGFVMQDPDHQIVTDKVWHELAFGLENMGLPQSSIARRTAEMSSYFGIEDKFDRNISELSGGQKQLINLAAVMVTEPGLLILDEPTAQLDPITASDFINTVKKLNRDLSLTVIIAEHRLEEIIPLCDKLLVIENGRVLAFGKPHDVAVQLYSHKDIMCGMPAAARISAALGAARPALSVIEGRELVRTYGNEVQPERNVNDTGNKDTALEFHEVYFRYERELPDVLKGLSFSVNKGEIYCILGGNGSGKTTALGCASGIIKPYSGTIRIFGKKLKEYKNQTLYKECLALMPQDIKTVFLRNTVREELEDAGTDISSLPFDLTPHLDKHPYDLSGGEMQLCAFAKVLALKPKILLLDEPTKGLDAASKIKIIALLKQLTANGMTIVTVTHDVEFAAECADRCALFFRGEIVSAAPPDEFFSENSFYTTAASRITRGHFRNAVTAGKAAELCLLNGRKAEKI